MIFCYEKYKLADECILLPNYINHYQNYNEYQNYKIEHTHTNSIAIYVCVHKLINELEPTLLITLFFHRERII